MKFSQLPWLSLDSPLTTSVAPLLSAQPVDAGAVVVSEVLGVVESVTATGVWMTVLQLEEGWPLLHFPSFSELPPVHRPPGCGAARAWGEVSAGGGGEREQ